MWQLECALPCGMQPTSQVCTQRTACNSLARFVFLFPLSLPQLVDIFRFYSNFSCLLQISVLKTGRGVAERTRPGDKLEPLPAVSLSSGNWSLLTPVPFCGWSDSKRFDRNVPSNLSRFLNKFHMQNFSRTRSI